MEQIQAQRETTKSSKKKKANKQILNYRKNNTTISNHYNLIKLLDLITRSTSLKQGLGIPLMRWVSPFFCQTQTVTTLMPQGNHICTPCIRMRRVWNSQPSYTWFLMNVGRKHEELNHLHLTTAQHLTDFSRLPKALSYIMPITIHHLFQRRPSSIPPPSLNSSQSNVNQLIKTFDALISVQSTMYDGNNLGFC